MRAESTIIVQGDGGKVAVVGEGQEIPEWADLSSVSRPDPFSDAGTTAEDDADGQETPVPPAKSGPNAGAAKWAAYAQSLGVEVPDGAKQGEIIALLEAAGKPTE